MLRRLPTALTITSEDIAVFEEAHLRRLALIHFQRTGEDPNGYFTGSSQRQHGENGQQETSRDSREGTGGVIDPNDELKPLPGDKARIVRGREERILGSSAAAGTGRGR